MNDNQDGHMKSNTITAILLSFFIFVSQAKGQDIELVGSNVLNGAITGAALGVATMGLQNSNDFTPLRLGVGSGIIAGAGIAVYDLTTLSPGQQFYISGMFNDGTNTSVLIVLDTFYGGAFGAVIGAAGMMLLDRPIVDGLQYGGSIGAWAGFGFGLVDALILAERYHNRQALSLLSDGALYTTRTESMWLRIVQPAMIEQPRWKAGDLSRRIDPAVDLFSLRVSF